MPNFNHDERGRFAQGSQSGAATGDHSAQSPSATSRNLPGHGNIPRSKVIGKHAGAASVGTSSGGGGGGGSSGGGGGSMSAKQERIKMQMQADERHKPTRSDADVAAMTALSGPRPIAPGKLDPRTSTLVSNSGAKPRIRMKARTQ